MVYNTMRTKLQNLNNISEKKRIELFFISQLSPLRKVGRKPQIHRLKKNNIFIICEPNEVSS